MNPLTIARDNLAKLDAFEARHNFSHYVHTLYDIPTEPDRLPGFSVDGQNAAARAWALRNFGPDGWTQAYVAKHYATAEKAVEGVRVTIWQAYKTPIGDSKHPQPINPARWGVEALPV